MRRLALVAAALVLAACAANPFNAGSVPVGATRQQVLERLGQPTRVVPIAGGERLQYSLQPLGRFAWMVDLDAAGRVTSVRQVMALREFNRIVPDQWTRADVEREFGPPALVDRVSSWNGPILTYRWQDLDGGWMFYYVYLDEAGVVRRAHQGMEFINTPDRGD
ncbi:hypothetical protein [Ramlibacter algicola]|uniref:Lipoprotein transmembrane n=1 Tax=Ramlibacter algicola TaxID=2795217 RepID=A0A934PVI8_9BURK|nr:hypothetical protein [Ramlibacter algicola]MBK0391235.1 hypothetical protein [Ramlibacter algicola]